MRKTRVNFSDSWGFMYFNSLWCYRIHGGCLIIFFLLLQYVNNFASYLFKSFYFYVHTKEYPITVWLHCRVTVSLHVWSEALMPFFLFINVVCIHRSVLLPATHIPTSPSGNEKTNKQIFILFFFLNNLLRWSCDSRDNTAVLSQLSHGHQSPTRNKR